jgi:hypothetical protein
LEVDANPIVPEGYEIRELPVVLIFRRGEVIRRLDGKRTKEELTEALKGT